jgi:hypothetical protein
VRRHAATVGLSAALLAVAVAALSVARSGPPREAAPARQAPPATLPSRAPGPVDVPALRDVFSFADEQARRAAAGPVSVRLLPTPAPPPTPAEPRLVGILRRSGRLVAALALDGEVELAGPGESAAGVTVTAVREDGVTIRRRDGGEATLQLPD